MCHEAAPFPLSSQVLKIGKKHRTTKSQQTVTSRLAVAGRFLPSSPPTKAKPPSALQHCHADTTRCDVILSSVAWFLRTCRLVGRTGTDRRLEGGKLTNHDPLSTTGSVHDGPHGIISTNDCHCATDAF